ncbi:MAG: hypothetical protein K6U04_07090 [Armatimonadetes bacterium]|nr:hypothetical protein [Armatimonadota bacterium]
MRDVLAERLLAEVMKWTPEDVARERPDLQALATFKYDEYQQFSPGMRFVESLALWLNQFDTDEERELAYRFVRSRLIFISSAEMAHLVTIAFPDFIRPFLIRRTADYLGVPDRCVTRIANSVEFKVLLRQSLFLGLSDGAHIDLFRRSNPEISHEQVWQTYEISEQKAEDMLSKLSSELEAWLGRKLIDKERRFRMLFLLDDFSGSGLSYLRKEPVGSKFAGKIHKVLSSINSKEGVMKSLFNPEDLHICIVLYVATTQGLAHLERHINDWLKENGSSIQWILLAIQVIPETTNLHLEKDGKIINLLKKYFDSSIIDEHYRKGRYQEPYLGFDQCALPLVLTHNTPNNSVPLLWFEEYRKYRGLFPRVSRHRRES